MSKNRLLNETEHMQGCGQAVRHFLGRLGLDTEKPEPLRSQGGFAALSADRVMTFVCRSGAARLDARVR